MNKGLITKGIFAVAVVAMTAVVGVVGFAHASPGRVAAQAGPMADGYGGGIGAILAALAQYQADVKAAEDQYRNDIEACFNDAQDSGVSPTAAATLKSAKNDVDNDSTEATKELSKKTSSTTGASASASALDSKITEGTNTSLSILDKSTDKAVSKVAPVTNALTTRQLNRCLRDARNNFNDSIQDAKRAFLAAIRNALH